MIFLRKKEGMLDPYTVEQVTSCYITKKRKFTDGDFIFKQTVRCASCNNGQMIISKIYGEVIK